MDNLPIMKRKIAKNFGAHDSDGLELIKDFLIFYLLVLIKKVST